MLARTVRDACIGQTPHRAAQRTALTTVPSSQGRVRCRRAPQCRVALAAGVLRWDSEPCLTRPYCCPLCPGGVGLSDGWRLVSDPHWCGRLCGNGDTSSAWSIPPPILLCSIVRQTKAALLPPPCAGEELTAGGPPLLPFESAKRPNILKGGTVPTNGPDDPIRRANGWSPRPGARPQCQGPLSCNSHRQVGHETVGIPMHRLVATGPPCLALGRCAK